MRIPRLSVIVLAILLLPLVASADGASSRPAGPTTRESLRELGEYGFMIRFLDLRGKQREKMIAVARENIEAMRKWESTKGKEFASMRNALAEARRKHQDDPEAYKAARNELLPKYRALREEQQKLRSQRKARALALLTEEQKNRWAGFELRRYLMARLYGPKLSEEQKAQVQKLCEEAVKTLPDADDRKNRRKRYEQVAKLVEKIVADVFDDEQRKAYEEAKSARERRRRKPTTRPASK